MRLTLQPNLRTRQGDYIKDSRLVNAYPESSTGVPVSRKRAGTLSVGVNVGANAQMLCTLLDSHNGIGFSSAGSSTVNESSGSTATNTWTSTARTTTANCTAITPSLSLTSQRGNGIGQYFYRTIRWRVEYFSGGSWVAGSWNNVDMGAQFSAIASSAIFTFPSSAAWQWRIYSEAFDTNGTVFGTASYTYSNTTVTATIVSYTTNYPTTGSNGARISTAIDYGAATGSGEIYQINYSWSALFTALAPATMTTGFWTDPNGTAQSAAVKYLNGVYPATKTVTGNKTISGSGYVQTFSSQFYVSATPNMTLQLSGSATIYRRTAIPNSTTPSNIYMLNSYTWTLQMDGGGAAVSDATKFAVAIVGDDLSLVDLTAL